MVADDYATLSLILDITEQLRGMLNAMNTDENEEKTFDDDEIVEGPTDDELDELSEWLFLNTDFGETDYDGFKFFD